MKKELTHTILIPMYVVFCLFLYQSTVVAQLDTSFAPVIGGTQGGVGHLSQRADGKIVMLGDFAVVGEHRRSLIALLNPDGTVFDQFDAGRFEGSFGVSINAVSSQSDSKLIIAGQFSQINSVVANRVARLHPDGSVDTSFNVGSGPNNTVYALASLTSGKTLVGGSFTQFGTSSVGKLIRLNADGSVDVSFNPTNNINEVYGIEVQPDGKVVVVGLISSTTGSLVGIIRLNADGTTDTSFTTSNLDQAPACLAIQPDGKILMGGSFTSVGAVPAPRIVRFNSNGTVDTSFQGNVGNGSVSRLSIQPNGKILLTGNFTQVNGQASRYTARLETDGTFDSSLSVDIRQNSSGNNGVSSVLATSDQIILGGRFNWLNGQFRHSLAALDLDGTIAGSFNVAPTSAGFVQAMEFQPDGKLVVGGTFISTGGKIAVGITRLNPDGSIDPGFNSGTGTYGLNNDFIRSVSALRVQQDGKLLIGGDFDTYDGTTIPRIARLNSDGSRDTSFFPASVPTTAVRSIDVQADGKVLVAGISGVVVSRLNVNGTLDTTFNINPGLTAPVFCVKALPDGKILVGGNFTSIGGAPRRSIARLNSNGTVDQSFGSDVGLNGGVSDIEVMKNGQILVGGFFTAFDSATRNRLARLNVDGSLDTSFDPGGGADDSVNSIKLDTNGSVIAAGSFTSFDGTPRSQVAKTNGLGNLDFRFASDLQLSIEVSIPSIRSIEKNATHTYFGGSFTAVNGQGFNSLMRLRNSTTKFDFDGDSKTDISIFRPSVGQWWYRRSSDQQVPALQFGVGTDIPVPADFTGDGKTDIAFFRPGSGEWFVLDTTTGGFFSFPFGANGDIPAPGDFDGDGTADPAVFRPSAGTWFILRSSDSQTQFVNFGIAEDKPVVGDYDNDNKDDVAIYRPSVSQFWILRSTAGLVAYQFGAVGDKAMTADFSGDGSDDIAVFRPSTGFWFVLRSEDEGFFGFPFGANGDLPAPGDYDGDGTADPTVFRPATNEWFSLQSTAGTQITSFGASGDAPVPGSYVR